MTFPRSLARRLLATACLLAAVAGCSDGSGDSREESGPAPGALLLGESERMRAEAEAEAASSRNLSDAIPVLSEEAGVPLARLGYDQGSADAPVQVVEFSDFGCGYCRRFHLESWPSIRREYIEAGKVEWKYVPMILGIFGPNAEEAAFAGDCAIPQDRFPEVRDRLFEEQGRWKGVDEPRSVLREIVREAGVEVEPWEACMDDDRTRLRIASANQLARQYGLRGTPTFFIAGEGMIPGAVPLPLFRSVLDQIYAARSGG